MAIRRVPADRVILEGGWESQARGDWAANVADEDGGYVEGVAGLVFRAEWDANLPPLGNEFLSTGNPLMVLDAQARISGFAELRISRDREHVDGDPLLDFSSQWVMWDNTPWDSIAAMTWGRGDTAAEVGEHPGGPLTLWFRTTVSAWYGGAWRLDLSYIGLILDGHRPPRRIFPRDDGLTGGAPRNYPPSKGVQSGNRAAGGYV